MTDDPPVLVTGATGMLGTHLVASLNRRGIVPRVLLRRSCPNEAWGDLRVVPVEGDLADGSPRGTERLAAALSGVDTVYHLAAIVRLSGRDESEIWGTNATGTLLLDRAAARAGVRRFVHVGTIGAVGASEDGRPIDEEAVWNLGDARNPYFDSKRAAEEYLLGWERTPRSRSLPAREGGPEVVAVDPSVILGPRASVRKRASRIREGKRPPRRAVEERPRWLALLRYFPFDLPVTLNLVDADDVAEGTIRAAERGRPGERYLLTGENLTFRRAVDLLGHRPAAARFRIPLPVGLFAAAAFLGAPLARLAGRSPRWLRERVRLSRLTWHYSCRKAERELGYAHRPAEETMARILGSARRGAAARTGIDGERDSS